MKKTTTWILIADGGRARLVVKENAASAYTQVVDMDFITDSRPTHDVGTDRPGRSHDRMGDARHAMEPPSDPHREEKRLLAERVAGFLEEKRQKNAFERLIVIAAPKAMGDLRQGFSPSLKAMVVEEISKDLTMFSLHDLQDKLPKIIEITH
jgi:protein required for attachment to host cells